MFQRTLIAVPLVLMFGLGLAPAQDAKAPTDNLVVTRHEDGPLRDLKVFVANGYYDLATPYFATDYTFNHLGLDAGLRGNVRMDYYEAGHMMYVHKQSHEQMRKDLVKFYQGALQ